MNTDAEADPARTEARDRRHLRLIQLIGALFAGYLIIGIPLPVLPLHVHNGLGYGPFTVGIVAGAQFAAAVFSRMFAGHFTDTRGPKTAFIIGLLLAALAAMLYLLSLTALDTPPASLLLLLAGRVVLGIGESFMVTGALGWGVLLLGAAEASKAMSWLGTSLYAAFAIGAPVGTYLYGHFGFVAVACATAVVPAAAMLLILPMPAAARPAHVHETGLLKKVAGVVLMPGTALALSGVGFSAVMTFAALLYHSRDWSPAWLAFTALSVAFICGRVLFGHLPDRFGGLRVALGCIVIEAAGQALIWLAPNAGLALLGVTVTGLGYSLVYPGLGALVIRAAPPQSRALALGAYTAFLDVSLGFSGPLLGLVATGRDLSSIYAVSTFVALGAAVMVLWTLMRASAPAKP